MGHMITAYVPIVLLAAGECNRQPKITHTQSLPSKNTLFALKYRLQGQASCPINPVEAPDQ